MTVINYAGAVEDYRRYRLVPLQRVDINEKYAPDRKKFYDIVFAFSRTHIELRITEWFGIDDLFRIEGVRVNLLFRSYLDFRLDDCRLVAEQSQFLHCPNLVAVVFSDDTHYNDGEEMKPYPIVRLESLVLLVLCG
ncbi:hypothetical protein F5H01DRAFT_318977 [Linnemannia elongata]|nr:hypothetical protein F5H01DRAFT_318977 [Linnemannia elongata]